MKLVEKQKLPEVDAEFLKIFGLTEEEGIEKLKADVRKNMEREVKNGLRNQVKGAAFDALVAANEVELPASMVAQEVDPSTSTNDPTVHSAVWCSRCESI